MKIVSYHDYRRLAKSRLPKMVFDYLDGGADDENALQHNRNEFANVRLSPKRLVDVSNRNIERAILGNKQAAPFAVAPTGLNGLFSPEGDLKIARAAARAGIPFSLSTASTSSIEEVAQASDGELWFQLYVIHKELAKQFIQRARDNGYQTLILTVDVAVNGNRERDLKNGFSLPIKYTPKVIWDGALHPSWSWNLVKYGMPKLANFETAELNNIEIQSALMSRKMDASFDWQDLKWLRDEWPHRLIVKGINNASDAVKCAQIGVDGVVLSNHGGRQLDSCISPVQALEEVVSKVDIPVMIDSGVRRGSDIVKAIALGAEATLIGRPLLWALAARGEYGVDEMIKMLKDDVDRTLAHIGCSDINDVNKSFVFD
ncbi:MULTISPECIES: alpha-hydroxy-acid oxidizing protein [Marinobacter]|jgi:(S)-mandelate dehydrogenase|uniref:alpha-hydroxy-acid oxidizing protein n=3 Tax=Marinobacteraceae TaxID=2887365 RepID=UPI002941C0C0|nr:alpha-hydroxy-acid oxidizing protein [Marinobacter salarius]WOI19754.1 alpha-hydroxy-acid oxidizing protein [Marinobacter salarius]